MAGAGSEQAAQGPDPPGADGPDGEGESMRLFVALDPDPAARSAVDRWQRRQLENAGEGSADRLRAVDHDALHVTLAFLGDRSPAEAAEIGSLVGSLEARPASGRFLPDPVPVPRRRPRLFALEVESPAAVAIEAELSDGLAGLGIELEGRPFWPHVTVFRLRGGGGGVPRLGPLPDRDGHAFGFVRTALYRSELRPEGSIHSLLAANQLPTDGD